MTLRLNLGKYLEHHHISAYRVVQVCKLAPNTIYTLARQPAQRIDLDTISALLAGLQTITGQPVQIADLIEEVDAAPTIENPKLAALLKSAKPALTLETMRGQKLSAKEREAFERSLREVRESERITVSAREASLIETMSGRDQ
jgi:uncharacterized membrane protein